eukprot:jgi/Botrbrau1/15060/Bobra.118_2s0008.1
MEHWRAGRLAASFAWLMCSQDFTRLSVLVAPLVSEISERMIGPDGPGLALEDVQQLEGLLVAGGAAKSGGTEGGPLLPPILLYSILQTLTASSPAQAGEAAERLAVSSSSSPDLAMGALFRAIPWLEGSLDGVASLLTGPLLSCLQDKGSRDTEGLVEGSAVRDMQTQAVRLAVARALAVSFTGA